MKTQKQLAACAGLALLLLALFAPAARADFGIESLKVTANNEDGTVDLQAGSHPYEWTLGFKMNLQEGGLEKPEGDLRDLIAELPPGLVGNPLAVPRCPGAVFEGDFPHCPGNTQVGILHITLPAIGTATIPVYNLVPAAGVAASLGASVQNFNSFQEASLRSGSDFGVTVTDLTIPHLEIQAISETIWGVPAAASHDPERTCPISSIEIVVGCSSDLPPVPFFTLPTACGEPIATTIHIDSVENPGVFESKTVLSEDEGGAPAGIEGCNHLEFNPSISSQPTTNLADSPSGFDFDLHVPQAQVPEQEAGRAEACGTGTWIPLLPSGTYAYDYRWLRNGTPIPGATSASYQLQEADAGASLQCEVTARSGESEEFSGHAASEPALIPPSPPLAPPTPAKPTVEIGGEIATCEPGNWGGEPSFSYRWFKNGVEVPGQINNTYNPEAGEAYYNLQCAVTGANAGGAVVAFSGNKESQVQGLVPEAFVLPRVSLDASELPLATAAFKDVTVNLPAGLSINPSAANGLDACSEQQIGYAPSEGEIHFTEAPQSCPDAAKVGSLEVKSPLVDHQLEGAVYVAEPYQNPFGSLLAIYLVIEDEKTGVIAKFAGEVKADPQTGQLSTTVTENPQLPIEDVGIHLFKGPRATLKTPLTCGTYATTSTIVPWSTPEGADAHPSDSFATAVAPGGAVSCPKQEGQAPHQPNFSAGTISPQAGAYSPFVLKITRADGSQRLAKIDTTLPKGLSGKLAGVPYCSEAQIAQAISREAPNQGAVEQENPSCPAASEVGTVAVGAGAGITPYYATGHAYLAGPYKDAPLSLAVITPAVAGPFDLGAVVVRTALYVDPETALIHATSDPIPQIIDGIPLDVRSISLNLARPEFTLNPTSCNPTSVLGSAVSALGINALLSNPFQVGGCKSLRFRPRLALSLHGGTTRGKHPALKAVLTYPKRGSYANVASAQITLPHSEFIENSHFNNVCTRVQFSAGACPKGSIYGRARAITPLLEKPLEGPVYLRTNPAHQLPDLVVALNGQVNVVLAGLVDTGKGGGIRNTFETAPDAPVSKFVLEMQGGRKGLLVNSENICRKPQRALAHFSAQNGKVSDTAPLIANDCKARRGRKAREGRGGRR